jgi:hypothetical protein
LKTEYINERIDYTGKELRSHFAYQSFDIMGDSLVAFSGACEVKIGDLVDLADVKEEEGIYSEDMLHFIGEFFDHDLDRTILRQRLLIAIMKDAVAELSGCPVVRSGDDIYEGVDKLSVSIATLTPVSAIIHTGINISSKNTPVPTKGLKDYGIDTRAFAERVLVGFVKEMEGVTVARCKVRGVD